MNTHCMTTGTCLAAELAGRGCYGCFGPSPILEIAPSNIVAPLTRLHVRLLVHAIDVNDQMQRQVRGKHPIQAAQKSQAFLMMMPGVTFRNDLAVQVAQRRKERRGAVEPVVVHHRPAAAVLQRQPRRSAIQGLNLASLVQTQYERLLQWVQIQSHHIGQLPQKSHIPRKLERATQMRLQTVQLPPVSLLTPCAWAINRQLQCVMPAGLLCNVHLNDPVALCLIVFRFAHTPGRNLPNRTDPPMMHSLAPQLYRRAAHSLFPGDRHVVLTRERRQRHPAAQRHLLRGALRRGPLLERRTLNGLQTDRHAFVRHASLHARAWIYYKPFYATLH